MSNYTSKANVEKYLGITISIDIAGWLNAVDLWIENYLGRTFKDGSSDTKYYDGYGGLEIWIDDFEGIPVVTTLDADGDDETVLTANEDFYTYPLNETTKNRLVLIGGNNRIGRWPKGSKRLKVVASFGLVDTPADITLAATMLASAIMGRLNSDGNVTQEKVGDTALTYKSVDEFVRGNYTDQRVMGVYSILDQYRLPIL